MTMICSELPKLITLNDYNGLYFEYDKFCRKLFRSDMTDLIINNCMIIINNETYNHIITREMETSSGRTKDLNRWARIAWIKPLLTNSNCNITCNKYHIWNKKVKKRDRLHIFCENAGYIIVLEKNKNFYYLITAFCVDPFKRKYYLNESKKYSL